MAITEGTLLEISLNMEFGGAVAMNVWAYEVTGTFTGISAAAVGQAWWNDVKTVYRAMVRPATWFLFKSVTVREMNNASGELAEWNIPSNEQQGTRSGQDASDWLPQFNAGAFRLAVGSRLTRPGQKRIPGLLEVDQSAGGLSAGYVTLIDALATHMVGSMTLGAPAVGMDLLVSVFKKDATGAVIAHQPVIGYVLNSNVSSQVSRKFGVGS